MFSDPSSRLFWPLLISSGLVALIWFRKDLSTKKIKEAFIHTDSLIDLSLMFFNIILKMSIFSVLTISAASIAMPIIMIVHKYLPWISGVETSPIIAKLMLTISVLVADDFLRFIHHFFMHKMMWPIHKTHHSAKKLTPLTLFRTHPLESLMAHFRSILTHAFTITVMVLFFKDQLGVYDFLGVNLFGFIFNATLANLRHSSVPISFGFLEYFFISPRMHQIHHSSANVHYDKNFGVIFSLWDQLFGSFYKPTSSEMKSISYGLGETETFGFRQGIAHITPALTRTNPTISS